MNLIDLPTSNFSSWDNITLENRENHEIKLFQTLQNQADRVYDLMFRYRRKSYTSEYWSYLSKPKLYGYLNSPILLLFYFFALAFLNVLVLRKITSSSYSHLVTINFILLSLIIGTLVVHVVSLLKKETAKAKRRRWQLEVELRQLQEIIEFCKLQMEKPSSTSSLFSLQLSLAVSKGQSLLEKGQEYLAAK